VNRYRALLRVPGARGPVVVSALGSLPIGMYIIGLLLLAQTPPGRSPTQDEWRAPSGSPTRSGRWGRAG
jgi:hypothetical protein